MSEDERIKEFEDWAQPNGFVLSIPFGDESYESPETQAAWLGWQGKCSQQPESEPVGLIVEINKWSGVAEVKGDGVSRLQNGQPLYTGAPSAALTPARRTGWTQMIDRIVPALDPVSETEYCCEWSLWQDRERIRRELLAAAPSIADSQTEENQND